MLKVLARDVTAVHELGQYLACLLLRVLLRVPQRPKVSLGFKRIELNSMPLLASFLLALLLGVLFGIRAGRAAGGAGGVCVGARLAGEAVGDRGGTIGACPAGRARAVDEVGADG
jgi:hypothetical protein